MRAGYSHNDECHGCCDQAMEFDLENYIKSPVEPGICRSSTDKPLVNHKPQDREENSRLMQYSRSGEQ
jgi:hypothetical protein